MKIYGRNSIVARLKANPKSIRNIFIEEGRNLADIETICKSHNISISYLKSREFQKQTQDIRSQGIIAEIGKFEYVDFDDFLTQEKEELPTILFLDSLNDPQNLGGILRTAACFGGFAIVLPRHDSVEVTEAALRVASGGENYVPVIMVTNLSHAIRAAKDYRYWIGGTVVDAGEDLRSAKLNFPLGLVIGSEAKGIRKGLINHLDFKLGLPMGCANLSFNVSIATAIFCYEVTRQRRI